MMSLPVWLPGPMFLQEGVPTGGWGGGLSTRVLAPPSPYRDLVAVAKAGGPHTTGMHSC